MRLQDETTMRDNSQERKIEIPINLLDCENCEGTKENGDDASLIRFKFNYEFLYFPNEFQAWTLILFLSFALEKFSSYPDGPELPLIGFDSPFMAFNNHVTKNLTQPHIEFHKELVVKSGISESLDLGGPGDLRTRSIWGTWPPDDQVSRPKDPWSRVDPPIISMLQIESGDPCWVSLL